MLNTNLGLNGVNTNSSVMSAAAMNPMTAYNQSYNSSIFGNASGTNYNNDFLMPDYLKFDSSTISQAPVQNPMSAAQTTQQTAVNVPQQQLQPQVQPQIQPQTEAVQNGGAYSQEDIQNYIAQYQAQAQSGETPSAGKSNFKSKGFWAGLLAPVGKGLYNVFKGKAALSSVFNKNTLLKCPLYALIGFTAGTLIDGLFNKSSQSA